MPTTQQRLYMKFPHDRLKDVKMLQPAKQSRKRAAPEGLEAPGGAEQQPDAAAAAAFADLPTAGPGLAGLAMNHPRPASAAPGSPPLPMRARTSEPGAAPAMVASPGRNRQLFLAQMTPQHMTCDLSTAVVGLGVKHNLQAILVACYPLQKGPPARRHVTLCDQHGATGRPPTRLTGHSHPHSNSQVSLCGIPTYTNSPK